MKTLFFDIKPVEENFLKQNLNEQFEAYFFKNSLNTLFEPDDKIKDAQIISVFIDSNLSKPVLERFPNLKFIILRSVGYSHVDLLYAKEHNIAVFNAPHYGDYSIAEYVFALLLAISRKITEASLDIKNHRITDINYCGMELMGKTIGIVGLGAIGKKVAQIAKAFSMNVICHDINPQEGYSCVSLDELCKNSDIISINANLTSKTLHLFDCNRFEMMKDGVIIINTARGEIIKTKDLYAALCSKKVAFAALDVMECEDVLYEDEVNKPDINSIKENCLKNYYIASKLIAMKNVLITPHIAYNTKEAQLRILEITYENLIASTKFTTGAKNLVLL